MRPLDEIAFPVSGHQSFFNLGRAIMNANHVGNASTTIFTPRTRSALGMTKTKPAYYFSAQLSSRHRVDRRVGGFVGSLEGGSVGMHGCQCASRSEERRVGKEWRSRWAA